MRGGPQGLKLNWAFKEWKLCFPAQSAETLQRSAWTSWGTRWTQEQTDEIFSVHQFLWAAHVCVSDRSECVEKKDAPEVFFCCCEGSLCNTKFFYSPDSNLPQIPSKIHAHLCPCSPGHLFISSSFCLVFCAPVPSVLLFLCSIIHLFYSFTCSPSTSAPVQSLHLLHLLTCQLVHLISRSPVHLFTCFFLLVHVLQVT